MASGWHRLLYAIGVIIILIIAYQLTFRYEYVIVPQAGVVRIDRLSGGACITWPRESVDYSKYGCDK